MKKNKIKNKSQNSLSGFLNRNRFFVWTCVLSFLGLIAITLFVFFNSQNFSSLDLEMFEVGRVATRDIVAHRDISYIDEEATKIRKEAKKHLVSPVFKNDIKIKSDVIKSVFEFTGFLNEISGKAKTAKDFVFLVQEKYPTTIEEEKLLKFYDGRIPEKASLALSLSKQIMEKGFVEYPESTLNEYNKNEITIITQDGNRKEYKTVSSANLITEEEIPNFVKTVLRGIKQSDLTDDILLIITPFLKANILYDSKETLNRVQEALKQVEPVNVIINKNQKIIKKGFLIEEENFQQLKKIMEDGWSIDIRLFIGFVLFLLGIFIIALFLFSKKVLTTVLTIKQKIILTLAFDFVYIIVLICSQLNIIVGGLDLIPLLPVTFFVMLVSILISGRVAVFTSLVLSLAVLVASSFNFQVFLYALFSGFVGVGFINITGKRMDLIKTASILTVVNPLIAFVLIFLFPGLVTDQIFVLVGVAVNGFLTGVFVLGFLPILETLLNTPTGFRLMELSDLNAPMIKKMLLAAPGTYNHSMMVASLAESACRDIGANSILARVGAYYHDIGKIDNPEYFAENQRDHNKHIELNPRLSATIIRSHVKLGVEKARQLRLPEKVIDIIAEHHGNGVIEYFFYEAKKLNPDVDPKDFSYTGIPPRTKESAVVMLADTVEAACRTLEDHSVLSLQNFIDKLVSHKIENGQLDNSNLTFQEVKTIKKSFVGILAGYYHSRVEYPNQKESEEDNVDEGEKSGK